MRSLAPEPVRGRAAWSSPAGAVAVLLLVTQTVWRGAYLLRGYYTQDDFRMMRLGGSHGLTFDYLFQEYSGHLWPGDFLVAWITARVDPMSWTQTALALLALQAAGGAALWLVVSRLLGDRWARLPVLALFLFAPPTMWSLQWYAQAIGYLPVTLMLFVAVWALLRTAQDAWRPGPVVVVAAVTVGLAFQERALLIPLVLAGVALVLEADLPSPGSPRPRLLRHWRLWSGLAVVSVGYVLLHARLAPIEADVPSGSGGSGITSLARDFVLRTTVPALVGGPWRASIAGSLMIPQTWAVVVACCLAFGVVAVTLWFGGTSARRGWAMLGAYVLADILILFGGRTQFDAPLGLVPRYVSDVVPVAAIALACALRGFAVPALRRGRVPAVLAVCALFVASAAVSTTMMAPHQLNTVSRDYVTTLRSQLRANPRVVLYDGFVPNDVMIGAFGEDRRVSTVLARAPENPVFDVPSESMRIADEKGRLRDLSLVFGTGMEKPPRRQRDCGYPVTAQETVIPLRDTATRDHDVMRIGYYTSTRGNMTVRYGDAQQVVPVTPGLRAVSLVVAGSFDEVGLTFDVAPGTVCVAALDVGFPVPTAGTQDP